MNKYYTVNNEELIVEEKDLPYFDDNGLAPTLDPDGKIVFFVKKDKIKTNCFVGQMYDGTENVLVTGWSTKELAEAELQNIICKRMKDLQDAVDRLENNKPKLKTLQENNDEILERTNTFNVVANNGIECPQCGAELVDSDDLIMTSYPGQRRIHCLECDFKGTRYC